MVQSILKWFEHMEKIDEGRLTERYTWVDVRGNGLKYLKICQVFRGEKAEFMNRSDWV